MLECTLRRCGNYCTVTGCAALLNAVTDAGCLCQCLRLRRSVSGNMVPIIRNWPENTSPSGHMCLLHYDTAQSLQTWFVQAVVPEVDPSNALDDTEVGTRLLVAWMGCSSTLTAHACVPCPREWARQRAPLH